MKGNNESLQEPLNPQGAEQFHDPELPPNQAEINEQKATISENTLENLETKSPPIISPNENNLKPPRKFTPEDKKLGGFSPLKTIFRLSAGPLLSQVTNGLYGIITTIWISKACGDDGLSAVSAMNAFDNIGRSFGFFLAIAAATQIAFLYGKGRSQEAGQIIADLIRMSFVCGAITASLIIPILKPITKWFGASEKVAQLGIDYMLPLNICAFNSCLFIAAGGFLQGEGRTFLFGMSNVTCLCLNMLILDPLFLFGFKMGIRGASIATVCSEFIPGMTIIVFFYCHKFGVKPELKQLLKKFSPNTWPALKVGFSSLIAQLSACVPSILVRKYMGLAAGDNEQDFADVMAGFNAAIRITGLTYSIFNAISQAFIPAASYAYAAKRYKRYLILSFHQLWLMAAWGTFTCIFTWTIPKQLSMIFSNGEGYLKYAEKMVRYNNALGFIGGVRMVGQSMLQSIQMGPRATILSFINNFVMIFVFNYILYYTNPHDGARIIWCYPLSQLASCVFCPLFLWRPIRDLIKKSKEEDAEEEFVNIENELDDIDQSNIDKQSNIGDQSNIDEQKDQIETKEVNAKEIKMNEKEKSDEIEAETVTEV